MERTHSDSGSCLPASVSFGLRTIVVDKYIGKNLWGTIHDSIQKLGFSE